LIPIQSQRDRGTILSPAPLHLPVFVADGASTLARVWSRPRRRAARASAVLALPLVAGLTMLSGCSGRSSFLSGGPTMGQLKTSVAHLEFENAQMKRDLAKLQRDNRTMEDRLVQEEQDNGELTARLDDARNLLRERGLDPVERADAGRGGSRDFDDGARGARTLPAGQSSRKRRKPPVARIPGQFSPDLPASEQDDEGSLGPPQAAPSAATGADPTGLRFNDDLDHQTYYNGPLRWTPIAGRPSDRASQVR
jgi:hypothetical protein